MGILNKLDGNKTYLGMIAAGVLSLIVNYSDSITIDTPWVVTAFALIGTWTGVSMRAGVKKAENAAKSNGK